MTRLKIEKDSSCSRVRDSLRLDIVDEEVFYVGSTPQDSETIGE